MKPVKLLFALLALLLAILALLAITAMKVLSDDPYYIVTAILAMVLVAPFMWLARKILGNLGTSDEQEHVKATFGQLALKESIRDAIRKDPTILDEIRDRIEHDEIVD
jgi:hypothetical protein